jgi:hypothetical protein
MSFQKNLAWFFERAGSLKAVFRLKPQDLVPAALEKPLRLTADG